MRVVTGDLIEMAQDGYFDIIIHGCNCFNTFGAGIAKQIARAFPEAAAADKRTVKGDRGKLGTVEFVKCANKVGTIVVVANAYTQYDYRGEGMKADYDAIRECFAFINDKCFLDYYHYRIGYPRIGAGLAGGDWQHIAGIIDRAFVDGQNHTMVELDRR